MNAKRIATLAISGIGITSLIVSIMLFVARPKVSLLCDYRAYRDEPSPCAGFKALSDFDFDHAKVVSFEPIGSNVGHNHYIVRHW